MLKQGFITRLDVTYCWKKVKFDLHQTGYSLAKSKEAFKSEIEWFTSKWIFL